MRRTDNTNKSKSMKFNQIHVRICRSAVRRNVNKDVSAAKVQAQFEIPICLDSYVLVNEAAEHFESPLGVKSCFSRILCCNGCP